MEPVDSIVKQLEKARRRKREFSVDSDDDSDGDSRRPSKKSRSD